MVGLSGCPAAQIVTSYFILILKWDPKVYRPNILTGLVFKEVLIKGIYYSLLFIKCLLK